MKLRYQSCYLDTPIVRGRVYDLFVPKEITQDTAVFFVHGGGWSSGSRTGFHNFCDRLASLGYVSATTDYRLNANAFQQIRDIRESYDDFVSWLKEHSRPLRIAVHGASAGAHLGALLALTKPGQIQGEAPALLDNDWVQPESAVLQSTPISFEPWDEIFPQVWASMQNVAGAPWSKDPERYKSLSPCEYLDKSNPRILFMEAECEHMFPARFNMEFMKKQNALGIASIMKHYPMAEHGFFYDFTRKCQQQAWQDFLDFIN